MLLKAKRSALYRGTREADLLTEALKSVFRMPSESYRRIGKGEISAIEKLDYTSDGMTFVDRQFRHKVFTDNGLKSQVSFVVSPGGPAKMERNEFPDIGFK